MNPGVGADHTGATETKYAGSRPTKFGVLPERLDDAVEIARRHDLTIDTVHYHSGYLYQTGSIPVIEEAGRRVSSMVRHLRDAGCPVREVNTGGGLGVRFRPTDAGLDLDAWAAALARAYAGIEDLVVATEPGEYLAKFAATLLAEVVTVEDRGQDAVFVGLDAGWSSVNEHFVYRIPFHPIMCRAADAPPARSVTVSGNINEGDDLFAEDVPLPAVREGDVIVDPERRGVQPLDGERALPAPPIAVDRRRRTRVTITPPPAASSLVPASRSGRAHAPCGLVTGSAGRGPGLGARRRHAPPPRTVRRRRPAARRR